VAHARNGVGHLSQRETGHTHKHIGSAPVRLSALAAASTEHRGGGGGGPPPPPGTKKKPPKEKHQNPLVPPGGGWRLPPPPIVKKGGGGDGHRPSPCNKNNTIQEQHHKHKPDTRMWQNRESNPRPSEERGWPPITKRNMSQKQRNKALTLAHAQTIHYTSN